MKTILLVGIGGYGGLIAQEVLENAGANRCKVVGAVEPYLEASPVKAQLKDIPVFSDIKDFYKENTADLAIISTPIHLHKAQAILAMENGSDVLLEKPIAPTVQDALLMDECAKRTGRTLNIGFQLSYAPAILKMKEDILNNRFGRALSGYSVVCWPRNSAYFARPWAAKATINGEWVLDSIMMNACAHYLHNMLFLLGKETEISAQPSKIGASLYRANGIETFDTAFCQVEIDNNVKLRFSASHATEENINPITVLHFEKADIFVTEADDDNGAYAVYKDGTRVSYGATYKDRFKKIWHAVDVLRGNKQAVCTVKTALPHLKCVNAVSEHFKVKNFDCVEKINDVNTVKGLSKEMLSAFYEDRMPVYYCAEDVDVSAYDCFGGIK